MKDILVLKGRLEFEIHRRAGGIDRYTVENTVVNIGKNKLLDVMFHGIAAIGTWYLGLVDNASFSAIVAADTMASHGGWVEATYYSEATRLEWPEDAAANQSITNSVVATFTINANSKTVKGAFLTSDNVKGGTAGTLWAAGVFATPPPVNTGDLVKVTYTVNAT